MVAVQATGFVPAERPRLAVASDGTLAAIQEPTRITIVELPGGAAFAEVGVDPEADESELGWVGSPPRLVVLSRFATHSILYLLDPHGPRTIAEIRLESPMRLYATVGAHALAVGANGAAVLTAGETHLTPYQFPARAVPVAAGSAGAQFVVALAGSVEEWDPQSRMPKRRMRLPRPATITAVGGSDRVLWLTTTQEPARIDVLPLINRGQPKVHELPEEIATVSGHPRSDVVACIGAQTGALYVVDLDGRARFRTITHDGLDRPEAVALVVGRVTALLVAQAGRPLALIPLDGRDAEVAPSRPAEAAPSEDAAKVSSLSDPPRDHEADEPPTLPTLVPPAALRLRSAVLTSLRSSWRDEVVAWTRAIQEGPVARAAPTATAIDLIATRFELAELADVVVLLYGAHLGGERGVAPVDVARVLGGRWDEALGRGQLAACGVARYEDSRVLLAPAVCRVLDELPPRYGTLHGEPGSIALLGPCVVVSAETGPLGPLAARSVGSAGGAILAGAPGADPALLFREARAYGAVAMLRTEEVPAEPAILVVAEDAVAERLGLPRL